MTQVPVERSIYLDPETILPVSTLEITKLCKLLPLIDERTIYEVVRAFIGVRQGMAVMTIPFDDGFFCPNCKQLLPGRRMGENREKTQP